MLSELLFYEGLNVIKTDHARKGYALSKKVKLVEKNDPLIQLEVSKTSIKNLFKDLLDEIKGFKDQVTVKSLSRKDKKIGETELAPVYSNSITKTVINHKFDVEKSFQEVLYRIDNWINERSG